MKAAFVVILLAAAAAAQQNPSTMKKVGVVSDRFQSYNIEMVEVIGGRFWRPYASKVPLATTPQAGAPAGLDPGLYEQRAPIDLTNPRLRMLASALGPAYVRVSGTWANTVYFADSDGAAPTGAPEGFNGVLTRAQWKGVVDFSHAVNAELVTSFAVSAGTRDAHEVWTPAQAKKLVEYTHSIGGSIAAAEFINEPTFASIAGVPKGYDGVAYGRDFAQFSRFLRSASPETKLLGPGSVGEGAELAPMPIKLLASKDMLEASKGSPVDGFSYHFYGAVSERCGAATGMKGTTPADAALSEEWLARTDAAETFYAGLRDEYAAGKPMWLTETGEAACGGDRWASTFLDSFRYVDQMGRMARRGVQTVMHNTLSASDYGLIDEKTLTPRPSYWVALLWHKTMGTTVLDAGAAPAATVHLYAHCMKDAPGGVTLLAINLDRTSAQTMKLEGKATRYSLSAHALTERTVQLSGKDLTLTASGAMPGLSGVPVQGDVSLGPGTITFLTLAGAGNAACR